MHPRDLKGITENHAFNLALVDALRDCLKEYPDVHLQQGEYANLVIVDGDGLVSGEVCGLGMVALCERGPDVVDEDSTDGEFWHTVAEEAMGKSDAWCAGFELGFDDRWGASRYRKLALCIRAHCAQDFWENHQPDLYAGYEAGAFVRLATWF